MRKYLNKSPWKKTLNYLINAKTTMGSKIRVICRVSQVQEIKTLLTVLPATGGKKEPKGACTGLVPCFLPLRESMWGHSGCRCCPTFTAGPKILIPSPCTEVEHRWTIAHGRMPFPLLQKKAFAPTFDNIPVIDRNTCNSLCTSEQWKLVLPSSYC